MGHTWEAESCLRIHLAIGEEHQRNGIADRTVTSFRSGHLLAEVLLAQGRTEEAALEAQAVTRARPGFGHAWVTLGEAAAILRDKETSEQVCQHFRSSKNPQAAIALKAIRAAELRHQGNLAGGLAEIGEHREHPAVTPIAVQLLADLGVRGEELATAIEAALRVDPLNLRVWGVRRACLAQT